MKNNELKVKNEKLRVRNPHSSLFTLNSSLFRVVYEIVHKTIACIYPKYYPQSAVEFFHNYHSKENMQKQLAGEDVFILFDGNNPAGTATLFKNEIKRFFILPEYQGKGYGKYLLTELEKNLDQTKYGEIILDASLSAVNFYKRNGYVYKNYKTVGLNDGNYLCYLEMVKKIDSELSP